MLEKNACSFRILFYTYESCLGKLKRNNKILHLPFLRACSVQWVVLYNWCFRRNGLVCSSVLVFVWHAYTVSSLEFCRKNMLKKCFFPLLQPCFRIVSILILSFRTFSPDFMNFAHTPGRTSFGDLFSIFHSCYFKHPLLECLKIWPLKWLGWVD